MQKRSSFQQCKLTTHMGMDNMVSLRQSECAGRKEKLNDYLKTKAKLTFDENF